MEPNLQERNPNHAPQTLPLPAAARVPAPAQVRPGLARQDPEEDGLLHLPGIPEVEEGEGPRRGPGQMDRRVPEREQPHSGQAPPDTPRVGPGPLPRRPRRHFQDQVLLRGQGLLPEELRLPPGGEHKGQEGSLGGEPAGHGEPVGRHAPEGAGSGPSLRQGPGSSESSSRRRIKDDDDKKPKRIREESFPAELVFQRNDFSYIDAIVDPNRAHRAGPKGYPPSAIFVVLLLMYLKEMKTILALVRFLNTHPELSLNLHRRPSLGRMVAVLKRLFSSPML